MEAAIAKGRPLPQWYLDEPTMFVGYDWFITAFWRLTTDRPMANGGLGPIPWSSRLQYAIVHGIPRDMIEAFVDIIGILDTAYLKWMAKEMQPKTTKGKVKRA